MFPKLSNIREQRMSKLSDAPVEHAEALLDLYELLQVLHERGTLDLLRGLAGASDDIIARLAEAGSQPGSVRAARNLIEISKLLTLFDPEGLQKTVEHTEALLANSQAEPPGMWAILRRMTTRDARRAFAFFAEVLNETGRRIRHSASETPKAS
jgi:uncharacterized protein YjgD (DUF1641 family)